MARPRRAVALVVAFFFAVFVALFAFFALFAAGARFFVAMRDKSPVPGFLHAWIHIPLGLLILAFHPVWSGPGLIVTLIGAGLTLKGTLMFVRPQLAMRSLAHVSEDKVAGFRIAGFVSLALGLICGWIAYS